MSDYEMDMMDPNKLVAPRSEGSSVTSCSETVYSLVKNKLTSLREELKTAEKTNNHSRAIELKAHIFRLEYVRIELVRFW